MTEQYIQKKIAKSYEDNGYLVIKLAKTNINGIPDLLAIKDARITDKPIVFIEVKKPGGILSKLQEYWLDKLEKLGFTAYATTTVSQHYCKKKVKCQEQCLACKNYIDKLYDNVC
jgi:hypothetical protein